MKEFDLGKEKITKLFFTYGLTSMVGVIVFCSYSLIDSVFIGRYTGEDGMAAVTLSSPVLSLFCALALVLSVGCNTKISAAMGNEDDSFACKLFSMGIKTLLLVSVITTLLMVIFPKFIATLLQAKGDVFEYSVQYIRINGIFATFFLFQGYLSNTMNAIGKPAIAMISNISIGIVNILLDYVFIAQLDMGVTGAALASGITALIAALICFVPIVLKDSKVKFNNSKIEWNLIGNMMYNGLSDGLSALSTGIIALIFNAQIIRFFGDAGLTSYGVVQAIIQFFGSILIGFTGGLNPIVAYNIGAKNTKRVRETVHVFCVLITAIASTILLALFIFKKPLISIFGDMDIDLSLTNEVFYSYCFMLFFMGLSTITVSYFTAIEDPKTSALLSVGRVIVFRLGFLFLLPLIFGSVGLWISVPLSEIFACLIGIVFMKKSLNSIGNG